MKKRILIVDDDEVNVSILRKLLRDEYEVDSVETGEACLETMKDFSPDLVLLDIMMLRVSASDQRRPIHCTSVGRWPGDRINKTLMHIQRSPISSDLSKACKGLITSHPSSSSLQAFACQEKLL